MKNNTLLNQKIDQTKMLIEDAFLSYPPEQTMIAWSAGKDSTLVLKLTIDVCNEMNLPIPKLIDIDQQDQFDEIIAFRDKLVRDWDLELIVASNSDFMSKAGNKGDSIPVSKLDACNQKALEDIGYTEKNVLWEPESPVCNHLLKTLPFNQTINEHQAKALYTGIRWDEHGSRNNETYFSQRNNPDHMRVHPILHMSERDVWDANFLLDIPYNGLYIQGYRSIGSKTGTVKNSNTPAWEQDLEASKERDGRSEEKEKMMQQLREWGYM